MTEPFERLDEAMNRRRIQLRMNWREVADAAGISYTALRAIRKGEYKPTELTARGLDDALRWAPGSVYAILGGGEPTPLAGEPQGEGSASARTGTAFSPGEALRRVVRSSALEFGVTGDVLEAVFQAVRQDLGGDPPEPPSEAAVRTDLSDLVRDARRAAGLSLQEVADRAVDPSSGEHVIDAAWLDRLEQNALDSSEYPEYPQTDALVALLGLDPVAVQDASGVQFHGVHTIWSDDGRTRGFTVGELTDPEDIAKARALMEEYGRPLRRRRDG